MSQKVRIFHRTFQGQQTQTTFFVQVFSPKNPQNNKIFPQDISLIITKASHCLQKMQQQQLRTQMLYSDLWWRYCTTDEILEMGEQDAEWTGQAKLIRDEESSICLSIADDMALLIAAPLAAV